MVDAMPVPKIPPKGSRPIRRGEGVADPHYLLAEIEELKVIAEKGGFGTLAYALEVAAIEARAQVVQQASDDLSRDD
jgi:hypothetical protein